MFVKEDKFQKTVEGGRLPGLLTLEQLAEYFGVRGGQLADKVTADIGGWLAIDWTHLFEKWEHFRQFLLPGTAVSIENDLVGQKPRSKLLKKLARVRIELYFTAILERIIINLVVKG